MWLTASIIPLWSIPYPTHRKEHQMRPRMNPTLVAFIATALLACGGDSPTDPPKPPPPAAPKIQRVDGNVPVLVGQSINLTIVGLNFSQCRAETSPPAAIVSGSPAFAVSVTSSSASASVQSSCQVQVKLNQAGTAQVRVIVLGANNASKDTTVTVAGFLQPVATFNQGVDSTAARLLYSSVEFGFSVQNGVKCTFRPFSPEPIMYQVTVPTTVSGDCTKMVVRVSSTMRTSMRDGGCVVVEGEQGSNPATLCITFPVIAPFPKIVKVEPSSIPAVRGEYIIKFTTNCAFTTPNNSTFGQWYQGTTLGVGVPSTWAFAVADMWDCSTITRKIVVNAPEVLPKELVFYFTNPAPGGGTDSATVVVNR